MFIMSRHKDLTVNSTTLSSINIEKCTHNSAEMREKYPDAHKIVAYGKGEKTYLLGVYENKEDAEFALRKLHWAMDNNDKTYEFW